MISLKSALLAASLAATPAAQAGDFLNLGTERNQFDNTTPLHMGVTLALSCLFKDVVKIKLSDKIVIDGTSVALALGAWKEWKFDGAPSISDFTANYMGARISRQLCYGEKTNSYAPVGKDPIHFGIAGNRHTGAMI